MTDSPTLPIQSPEELKRRLDVLLKESDQIVGEIRALQEGQRRIVTLVPPAVAIGIPLLLRPVTDAPPVLAAGIFAGFSIMFVLLVAVYIGYGLGTLRLSQYQMNHLAPRINEIAAFEKRDLFAWEKQVRTMVYKSPVKIGAFALAHVATLAMLYLPSLICASVSITLALQSKHILIAAAEALTYGTASVVVAMYAFTTLEHARLRSEG